MKIRLLENSDRGEWLRMRCKLWPGEESALAEEVDRFYSGTLLEPQAVFVAEESGRLVGFVELSIRPHAEGCRTQRIGYLEAWYVDVKTRRRGIGRTLVNAAENWARNQGCVEFASDSELSNEISAKAHLAIGFEEAETIRCFYKKI
jgi:aminoglycoside 6'-N-acetyltransferase I